jgi:hypothetical protein
MKKLLMLFFLFVGICASTVAQNAQLSFDAATNFTLIEEGFHPVKFQLKNGSNADIAGLLEYVQNNTKYFKVQVNGNELNLKFVEGVHWGVWMKVFGSMGVSHIEIREADQNRVVDPMEFLRYFNLINQ